MNPGFDFIGEFKKLKDETGQEYFIGTLDPNLFKKGKDEIRVVLMQGKLLPASLVGRNGSSQDNLYMFSQQNKGQG